MYSSCKDRKGTGEENTASGFRKRSGETGLQYENKAGCTGQGRNGSWKSLSVAEWREDQGTGYSGRAGCTADQSALVCRGSSKRLL